MPLTEKLILQKELDYFKSPLASEPAFIKGGYTDEDEDYQFEDKCVYQTDDGRKCAVGALIKPAHYDPKFDKNNGTAIENLSEQVLDYLGRENVDWLKQLQTCHDDCARNWDSEKEYGENDHFGRWFLETARQQNLLS